MPVGLFSVDSDLVTRVLCAETTTARTTRRCRDQPEDQTSDQAGMDLNCKRSLGAHRPRFRSGAPRSRRDLDARPQSAVGPDHDTARRSLTAGQRVSGHLQRSLVASVSDRDAAYRTIVSKMCYVWSVHGVFFLVGLGRSGAAEQQGAPSPFPWDPWERSDQWATAADVVSLKSRRTR